VTLHRFFVPAEAMAGDAFPIPATIERQVRTVLRLGYGERVVLLSGDGDEALCRVTGGRCIVEERRASTGEPRHRLRVAQALLKGDGLEEVVRHGTEVGVAGFQLVVTDRCVVRDISPRRLDRLRAVAREAAEQSERGRVPPVDAPIGLRRAVRPGSILLYERHDGARLASLEAPDQIVIGPEGGFTPEEVEGAEAAGAIVAGLGPRILRSETVAVAVASVVLSRTGDFA